MEIRDERKPTGITSNKRKNQKKIEIKVQKERKRT